MKFQLGTAGDPLHSASVIDITGPIQEGMWNYEPPFPVFHRSPLPQVPWVDAPVYCDIFEGIHSQTGTYLETPAHLLESKAIRWIRFLSTSWSTFQPGFCS